MAPRKPNLFGKNPYEVLGVSEKASDQELRAAYIALLRRYPPDRAPDEFERIRDAYDELNDPDRRASAMLFSGRDIASPLSYLKQSSARRTRAPLGIWLKAIRD